MAGAGSHQQGAPHPRDRHRGDSRDCLLPAQRRTLPDRLNEVARSHWGIENRLHWRLDVVMNEDQDRIRLGHGPETLAVLRHMALNVIQAEPSKGSLRGKLKRAGGDEAYFLKPVELF